MLTPIPDSNSSNPHHAAQTRMSELLDAAAKASDVPPEEFRAAIREAMRYADRTSPDRLTADDTPEAFVLSLVRQLF